MSFWLKQLGTGWDGSTQVLTRVFLGSVTHPFSPALIPSVDKICSAARSWHEHCNDFISSSTCTNAHLGNVIYRAGCPVLFLFSKHMRPYLISPIAHWESHLSYTSMQGDTQTCARTHTPLQGCVLQWCKPVDGLLPDDPNKTLGSGQYHSVCVCVRTHTHTNRLQTEIHELIPHMDIICWSVALCHSDLAPLWCK